LVIEDPSAVLTKLRYVRETRSSWSQQ